MNKHLQYNFYNTNIKPVKPGTFLFEGKPNDPNVVLNTSNGNIIQYISKKLSLRSQNGREPFLSIEHVPVTNNLKPLEIQFPLKSDSSMENNNLDYVFSNKTNELELNSLLPENENVEYKEDDNKIVIIFQNPIKIKTLLQNQKGEPLRLSLIHISEPTRPY